LTLSRHGVRSCRASWCTSPTTNTRAFQDLITTLAARLTEKNVPISRATGLATNVWSSVEGALILSRVLRSPEPFNLAIALLAATDDTEADSAIRADVGTS
jgi:hypothetical protein